MNLQQQSHITPEMKVSDMILNNHYMILMLEHFGIDLAVHEKTVAQICKENRISTEVFLLFANLFNGEKHVTIKDFTFEDIQTIIDFLDKGHKYYLEEKYPGIEKEIEQLSEINNQSEILLVNKFFNEYKNEVIEHLNYEEDIVFPYMKDLSLKIKNQETSAGKENKRINREKGRSDKSAETPQIYSVKEYKEHHTDIEEKLTDFKNLLIKYLPSGNDMQERRRLLFSLFDLEYDLEIHTLIEDLILIPLVEKIELQLSHKG